jgi:hypothetical protein
MTVAAGRCRKSEVHTAHPLLLSVCVCGKEVARATECVCSVVVCCTNGVWYMNQGLLSCDPRDDERVKARYAGAVELTDNTRE